MTPLVLTLADFLDNHLVIEHTRILDSNRSPRFQDVVRVCVRVCGTFLKGTLNMSPRELNKA